MSARYAVYFAPDRHSPWRTFGAHWLGRDEHDSGVLAQPLLENISPIELERITHEPRRYGFHATLKAPFRLGAGHDETSLVSRLGALALKLKPVALSPLRVTTIGDLGAFVALTSHATGDHLPVDLQALATDCVTEIDDLRAPLTQQELARRRSTPLNARQTKLLDLYGYPHVLERFRLHLTLTGPVEASIAQQVMRAVAPKIAQLNADAPLGLDRLCLFVERQPGAAFHRIIDLKLSA